MKIRYEFANGEVSEVEVSDALGYAMAEITHRAALRDRTETRRHVSLEYLLQLGVQIEDEKRSTDAAAEYAVMVERLLQAMDLLKPEQRFLIQQVYFANKSCAAIARMQGVNDRVMRKRLQKTLQKLKKNLIRRGSDSSLPWLISEHIFLCSAGSAALVSQGTHAANAVVRLQPAFPWYHRRFLAAP